MRRRYPPVLPPRFSEIAVPGTARQHHAKESYRCQAPGDHDGAKQSHRCQASARLPAEAPDVGRVVLLPPRSLGPSDPIAGVVCAHARPLRRRDQGLRDHAGCPADHVRAGPTQRRRGRRLSRTPAARRRRGRDRRGARENARVQGAEAIRPPRAASPSTFRASRSPSITTTSTSRIRTGDLPC